mgnify:CR=1 FL=1
MKYVVIDGHCGWGEEGTVVEVDNQQTANALLRSGVVKEAAQTETVDSAETVTFDISTPIAIQEAEAFEDKKLLYEYADEEHDIILDRRKSLAKMKNEFADKYQAKMQKIEAENKSLSEWENK